MNLLKILLFSMSIFGATGALAKQAFIVVPSSVFQDTEHELSQRLRNLGLDVSVIHANSLQPLEVSRGDIVILKGEVRDGSNAWNFKAGVTYSVYKVVADGSFRVTVLNDSLPASDIEYVLRVAEGTSAITESAQDVKEICDVNLISVMIQDRCSDSYEQNAAAKVERQLTN